MVVTIAFFVLAAMTFAVGEARNGLKARHGRDWVIDGVSLVTHFFVVPLVQMGVVYALYVLLMPSLKSTVSVPAWAACLMNLVVIDYAWYWNHRLFHAQTPLWNLHGTHHSAKHLDVFATARNAVWSPLFMVYIWFNALGVFLLKDPSWFVLGAAIGASLNLWGHTSFGPRPGTWPYKILSLALITPHDHFWHHSSENAHCNFATVFNWWDKLHGTWHNPAHPPKNLGYEFRKTASEELILF